MISPMPFCPSLPPWAKLTPVQVRISRPRIQTGGGLSPSGAEYSVLFLITSFISSSSPNAQTKPTSGLNSSAFSTPIAWFQSTPDVCDPAGAMNWFASPTPMIEPISACDELLGRPSAQVPRFQMMAASNRAKIIGIPGPGPHLQDQLDREQGHHREGDRARGGEHAQEVEEAGPDDGDQRRHRMGVDYGRHGVRGVVEAVHELEAERDQQGEAEHGEGAGGDVVLADRGDVGLDAEGGVGEPDRQDDEEGDGPGRMRFAVELGAAAWQYGVVGGEVGTSEPPSVAA